MSADRSPPYCPDCGLFVPCATCGKPRLLTRLGIAAAEPSPEEDAAISEAGTAITHALEEIAEAKRGLAVVIAERDEARAEVERLAPFERAAHYWKENHDQLKADRAPLSADGSRALVLYRQQLALVEKCRRVLGMAAGWVRDEGHSKFCNAVGELPTAGLCDCGSSERYAEVRSLLNEIERAAP